VTVIVTADKVVTVTASDSDINDSRQRCHSDIKRHSMWLIFAKTKV